MRNKSSVFCILILCFSIIIVGCIKQEESNEDPVFVKDEIQEKSVVERIESVLPHNWEITNKSKNTLPSEYTGSESCYFVHLEDPTHIWEEPHGFNYTSFVNLWFCPPDWNCIRNDITPDAQIYPAILLIENDDCKILFLTLGNLTSPDIIDIIKDEFS